MGDAARRPLTVALAFTLAAAILALEPAPSVSAASEYTVTDFSVLGLDGVELKNSATVVSGHFGANNPDADVTIKAKAVVDPSSLVVGDTVSLGKNSVVTDVAANELTGEGVPLGTVTSLVALPLVDDLPDTPTFIPGTEEVDLGKGEAVTLEPGRYGPLTTKKEATVTFTGGEYHFASWDIGKDAALYFQGPSQVYVDGPVKLGSGVLRLVVIPPVPSSSPMTSCCGHLPAMAARSVAIQRRSTSAPIRRSELMSLRRTGPSGSAKTRNDSLPRCTDRPFRVVRGVR